MLGPWKAVPIKGLGKNLQPTDITNHKTPHNYYCNIAQQSKEKEEVGHARYICLGCRADPNFKGDYVDVCEEQM